MMMLECLMQFVLLFFIMIIVFSIVLLFAFCPWLIGVVLAIFVGWLLYDVFWLEYKRA